MLDKFTMLFLNIREEMDACKRILREEFNSDIELVDEIGQYVITRPGKMLRPAVVIASAKVCGCTDVESMARVAACLEMMHNATLVQDDAIDHAETRRGEETVHKKWDLQSAVLMGDYLYAKALNTILKQDSLEMMKILGNATVSMCEAEMYQVQLNYDPDITEANYFRVVEGKTAGLVAAGCQLGAVLGEADEPLKKAFGEFGFRIGTAFQIIDDLFDYTSDAKQVGKPVGHDLREGKVTLPLIYTLHQTDATTRDKIRQIVRSRKISPDDWTFVREQVERHGGIEYSHKMAYGLISEALEYAHTFPQSLFKLTMMHLAQYVLKRAY